MWTLSLENQGRVDYRRFVRDVTSSLKGSKAGLTVSMNKTSLVRCGREAKLADRADAWLTEVIVVHLEAKSCTCTCSTLNAI